MVKPNDDFGVLMKRISPVLRRITHKLNGRVTFFNHDDLYQEALMRLWQDYGRGMLADKTDSYILQGCYFHLKNYIRKNAARKQILSLQDFIRDGDESSPLETCLPCEPASGRNFVDELHTRMLADTILNNGFTPREKAILALCARDFTVRRIGQRLGISHVMVVKMMSSIRAKCKKYAGQE